MLIARRLESSHIFHLDSNLKANSLCGYNMTQAVETREGDSIQQISLDLIIYNDRIERKSFRYRLCRICEGRSKKLDKANLLR